MRVSTSLGLLLGAIGVAVAVAFFNAPVSQGQVSTGGGGGGGGPSSGVPGGTGGHYTGPNDTVPPNFGGSPCLPTTCPTPCGPATYPSDGTCEATKTLTRAIIQWNGACPEFYNKAGYYREITIGDIKAACGTGNGVVDICFPEPCSAGTSAACIYQTIPFQWYPSGVPTTGGMCLPICGMNYGFKVQYTGSSSWSTPNCAGSSCGQNSNKYPFQCADLNKVVLQVDCGCFNLLLSQLQAHNLYSPFGTGYMNDQSVVFVVSLFCCEDL